VRLCGRDQRRKMIPYTAQGQIPRVTKRNSVVEGRIGGKRNGVGGSAAAVVDGAPKITQEWRFRAHPRGKVDGARSYRVAMVGTAAIAIQSIANPNSTTKKRLLVVGGGLCVGAGRKTT
jgi:hypothetical protein